MRDAVSRRALHKIDDWLLIILRFAITHELGDRVAISVLAADLDRLGAHAARSDFAFFARTSAEICDLIVDTDRTGRVAALRRHLDMIDNDRLRRALESALDIDRPATNGARSRSRRGSRCCPAGPTSRAAPNWRPDRRPRASLGPHSKSDRTSNAPVGLEMFWRNQIIYRAFIAGL